MKKIKYLFIIVLSLCFIPKVNAAGMSISANKKTVTVGSSVTVTVSASSVAGKFNVISSNNGILSGGGSTFLDNSSASFTFKALKTGTTNITASAVDAASYDEKTFNGSRTISITVVGKQNNTTTNNTKNNTSNNQNKSSNNFLKSLKIENQKLDPEFNKDTTEYNVTVPKETEKIKIEAEADDKNANVTGTGEKNVSEGMNKFEIVVTAENGYKKTYKINIEVEENPIKVKVNSSELNVIKNSESLPEKPNYYDNTTVKIDENDIPAYKGTITNYTLVGLKDDEGNKNLYIYNEKDNTYTLYKEFKFSQLNIYIKNLDSKKIPSTFKKYKETINEQEVEVYKLNKKSNYSLIYGLNLETNEEHIYIYDKHENTVQIYNREEQEKIEEELEKTKKLIIILIVVIVILVLLVTIGFTRKNKTKETEQELTKKDIKRIEKDTKKQNKKNKKKLKNGEPEM